MDVIKFIKEMGRMCDSNRRDNCDECPFSVSKNTCFMGSMWHNPEEAVEIVGRWGKEHPQKTYKDDFLEKFPKTAYPEKNLYKHSRWCDLYNYGDCDKNDNANCADCWNESTED